MTYEKEGAEWENYKHPWCVALLNVQTYGESYIYGKEERKKERQREK